MEAPDDLAIRPRTAGDLAVLVEVLTEQRPLSRYPLRWPLPFPVEQFLVRADEEAAWVATLGERVVGHVSVGRVVGEPREVLAAATGATDPAMVAVLFVAHDVRGRGVGGRLLDTAVGWARDRDRLPVLDVVASHAAAVEFYRRRGWRQVGRLRPEWLPEHEEPLLLLALSRQ